MNKEEIVKILLLELNKCKKTEDVPVACIITDKKGNIIAKSINNRHKKYSVLGHAEINAIEKAEKKIKDWRLDGYVMYVTLKPCEMCQKIIEESRLDKVYYLLDREKSQKIINNMSEIDDKEAQLCYEQILKDFFKNKR